jgi:TctA family transporter
MKRLGFPRAPLILGFILGGLAENYLHRSLEVWGPAFLKRPMVLAMLVIILCSLAWSFRDIRRNRGTDGR